MHATVLGGGQERENFAGHKLVHDNAWALAQGPCVQWEARTIRLFPRPATMDLSGARADDTTLHAVPETLADASAHWRVRPARRVRRTRFGR